MKRLLTSLVFLTNFCTLIYGQQYQIRSYNTDNILPHSTIFRIFQDQKGLMWFCTDISLASFDGIRFNDRATINDGIFTTSPMSVSEDDDGTKLVTLLNDGIVVVHDTGVSRYQLQDGKYPKFNFYSVAIKARIWMVGKDSAQYLYEISNHRIRRALIKNSKGEDVIFNKIKKLDGEVIAASSNGLYKIDDSNVKPFLHDLVNEEVVDIRKNYKGDYVIGTRHKVFVSDGKSILNSYDLGEDNIVGNLLYDGHDNIWVCMYGKTVLLISKGQITDIRSRLNIPNMSINDLYEDSEGNIWFATYNSGVFMIPSLNILSYALSEKDNTLPCHRIAALDSNRLLLAGFGKVSIWSNGLIEPFGLRLLKPDEFVYFAKRVGDAVYVGTPAKLIKKKLSYPFTESMIELDPNAGAISMCIDSRNSMWVGSYQNAYRLENDKVIEKITDAAIARNRINDIIMDKSGNLWFATQKALVKYDGHKFERIVYGSGDGSNNFYQILEDSRHRIWAITRAELLYLSENTNEFKTVSYKDGLASSLCLSLAEDRQNRLWVCTRFGLCYIDLNTLKMHFYSEGINNKEVLSVFCTPQNDIFVGTNDKLLSINANNVTYDVSPPPVLIRFVKTVTATIYSPKAVTLPYNESKIAIDFVGLSYRHPKDVEYRYKVKNLDESWKLTTNNYLELASIPPGEYVFVLNARKNKGPWSGDVEMPIIVSTPFWRTWWFLIFTCSVAIMIIYNASKIHTQKTESKKREHLLLLNKIAYLKHQALAALINPHFIFNCMNSIQHFLNKQDNNKANSYLADFASLIRLTIEDAQKAFIPLKKEITRLELYLSLEQLRFGKDLKYTINVAENVNPRVVRIPNMIIQPYVENAIWHGIMPKNGVGCIFINFTLVDQENELKVEVRDDGIGINQSKEYKSSIEKNHLGNQLTEERLQLLRQITGQLYDIRISDLGGNGTSTGTLVEIYIPVTPIDPDE